MKSFFVVCAALVSLACASTLPADFSEWEGRIVGGANANSGQFPYQVSLRSAANSHFCGATILNNRWVLSAAHCTIGRTVANTIVVVGAHLLNSGGTVHRTGRIVNHPSYNANTLANDISVVQTEAAIVFVTGVSSMAMGSTFVEGGVSAVASGWGQTSNPGSLPNQLQWLTTQTLSLADCRSRHSTLNARRVFDNTICTFTQNGQGMCMGDSGGPLVASNTVIGAVSWGIPCARGSPDVFARVSSHRAWVLETIG